MRVLLLSRYTRMGASSRLRTLQYLPILKDHGIDIDVVPFYDDTYLFNLYQEKKRALGNVLLRYLRRVATMLRVKAYDLVWVEKEILPWFPPHLERMLHHLGVPYVVDYDDAIFHRYDLHPLPWIRCLLGKKIDTIMRNAAMVIAGNDYIAQRAHLAGSEHVRIIPTVIDLDRYPESGNAGFGRFTIGWMGSPTTFGFLRSLAPVLAEAKERFPIRVAVVGAAADADAGLPFDYRSWTESSEVAQLGAFDVGIMPLPDTPWARGKCGYKLIQYMACGLPVIAARVGVNKEIVTHGENGFLVSGAKQWLDAIERLYTRSDLRRQMGRAARKTVEERYHLGITAPCLANCLRQAGSG